MKHLTSIASALLITLLITSSAVAQGVERERRSNPNREAAIPGLTQDQRKQIREITLSARQEMIDLNNQMAVKRARLRTLATGETLDADAASAVIDEIAVLQAKLMKQRLETRLEVRNLLTEEQKVIFDSRRPGKYQKFRAPKNRKGARRGQG